jgi:hypothetical protein
LPFGRARRRQHLHNQQPLAQVAPQGVVPPAAALSPESVQLLQSMARDLATVGQRIEQLKASIDQLKASQQQVSRENAKPSESKASEQNVRPKTSTPPPRPTAASTRKPVATLPSPKSQRSPRSKKRSFVISAPGADAPALAHPRRCTGSVDRAIRSRRPLLAPDALLIDLGLDEPCQVS